MMMFDEFSTPEQIEKQMPDFRHLVKIRVQDFYSKYLPPKPSYDENGRALPTDPNAPMRRIDYVVIENLSGDNPGRSVTPHPVSTIRCTKPPRDEEDFHGQAAWGRWQIVKPAYEAWKAGHEIVEEGTPLDAWPGITQDQAKFIRLAGINTVEQLASATSGQLQSIRLPHVTKLQESAVKFLEAKASSAIATDLQRKDEEINVLKSELEEMRDMMRQLMEAEQKPKRGPGRPKKEEAEASDASEAA